MARQASGMTIPALACLALALGVLFLALPRGFTLGGQRLELPVQLALMGGAFLAAAWGDLSGRDGRVLLGHLAAIAMLSPAYDPRAPLERLPAYLAVAVLLLLSAEFGLLHAKVARLAKLPRAHVTQAGKAREVELQATASRIAASWPTPLALGLGIVGLALAVQLLLAGAAPAALGQSVEANGPFGLVFSAVLVMGGLGLYAVRRRLPRVAEAAVPAKSQVR